MRRGGFYAAFFRQSDGLCVGALLRNRDNWACWGLAMVLSDGEKERGILKEIRLCSAGAYKNISQYF